MAAVDPDALLLVGYVGRAHGVSGEVKIIPETDDPQRLAGLERLFIGTGAERVQSYAVQVVRFQHPKRGTLAIVHLEGMASREDAEALRGLNVYALVDDLPPLEDDEFFIHDLIGLTVVTEDGMDVGVVHEIMELPAQPVGVVRREGQPDVMLPLVPAFIAHIDFDARVLEIRPIEGLLE